MAHFHPWLFFAALARTAHPQSHLALPRIHVLQWSHPPYPPAPLANRQKLRLISFAPNNTPLHALIEHSHPSPVPLALIPSRTYRRLPFASKSNPSFYL